MLHTSSKKKKKKKKYNVTYTFSRVFMNPQLHLLFNYQVAIKLLFIDT